jgi:hypothetical protein
MRGIICSYNKQELASALLTGLRKSNIYLILKYTAKKAYYTLFLIVLNLIIT